MKRRQEKQPEARKRKGKRVCTSHTEVSGGFPRKVLAGTGYVIAKEMSDSSVFLDETDKLHQIFDSDGYLLLRGFFTLEEVERARKKILLCLSEEGYLKDRTEVSSVNSLS
jgi:hypothetical protein